MNAITQIDIADATALGGHDAHDQHAIPTNRLVSTKLHPGALWVAVGAYIAMVGVFFVGFGGARDLLVSLGIVAVVLAAFVALPAVMARTGGVLGTDGVRFRDFLGGYFQTATGPISGKGALALIITIPVCLACGALAMAIILATV